MATVSIQVPSALRELVGGAATLSVDVSAAPPTVADVLDELARRHPALERRVRDERGVPRVHVNLFVGADNIRDLQGLATPVRAGAELAIIAAVSGG